MKKLLVSLAITIFSYNAICQKPYTKTLHTSSYTLLKSGFATDETHNYTFYLKFDSDSTLSKVIKQDDASGAKTTYVIDVIGASDYGDVQEDNIFTVHNANSTGVYWAFGYSGSSSNTICSIEFCRSNDLNGMTLKESFIKFKPEKESDKGKYMPVYSKKRVFKHLCFIVNLSATLPTIYTDSSKLHGFYVKDIAGTYTWDKVPILIDSVNKSDSVPNWQLPRETDVEGIYAKMSKGKNDIYLSQIADSGSSVFKSEHSGYTTEVNGKIVTPPYHIVFSGVITSIDMAYKPCGIYLIRYF